MASIFEAIEDTVVGGVPTVVKTFLMAVPVFVSYYVYRQGDADLFNIVGGVTLALLLTFMSIIIYNIRSCTNKSLPDFNPIPFILTLLKEVFVLPIIAGGVFLGIFLTSFQIPFDIPYVQTIYTCVVWAILGSIMSTSFVLFSKSGNILMAYNFMLISKYCVDIAIEILFYLLQAAILNFLVLGSIYYTFNVFWGVDNPVFIAICSYAIVVNAGIAASYLAQIDYKVIPRQDKDLLNNDMNI